MKHHNSLNLTISIASSILTHVFASWTTILIYSTSPTRLHAVISSVLVRTDRFIAPPTRIVVFTIWSWFRFLLSWSVTGCSVTCLCVTCPCLLQHWVDGFSEKQTAVVISPELYEALFSPLPAPRVLDQDVSWSVPHRCYSVSGHLT